jgi:hypothetical protein
VLALRIGMWHHEKSGDVSELRRANVRQRALMFLTSFVDRYETKDADRLRAELAIDEIRKSLSDTASSESPPRTNRFAEFEVSGQKYSIAPFGDGERAFSNRGYVWRDVPKEFTGWRFTQIGGNVTATIHIRVKSSGMIFAAGNAVAMEQQGWKVVTGKSFSYTDRGKTRLQVLAKTVQTDEEFDVFQAPGFVGTIVLMPPEE